MLKSKVTEKQAQLGLSNLILPEMADPFLLKKLLKNDAILYKVIQQAPDFVLCL
jgi:hypothetical protein